MEPYAYLYYLISRGPTITDEAEWDALLPANLDAETLKAYYLNDVR